MVDRHSRRWLGALLLLATGSLYACRRATTGSAQGYTAIPGEREFSGFVIARPLQQLEAAERGITGEQFQTLRSRAHSR